MTTTSSSGPLPRDRYPATDAEVAAFARSLEIPGIIDLHVHALPERLQRAVWRYFDRLEDPPWPIVYRETEPTRFELLRDLGVLAHTALAYAHRPGMAANLNEHTLALAEQYEQVIPTFTFHPEDGVADYVDAALGRGGAVAKVHLQVGRFHATDRRLDPVWRMLSRMQVPVVIHAGAVYGVDGGAEYCGADELRRLLDRHPDVVLVVAHVGAPDFRDFVQLAEEVPGLWMDTAMAFGDPPYLGEFPGDLLDRLRAMVDRVVFGSDFPSIPRPVSSQLRGLARLELDQQQMAGLLHDNAVRLLSRRRLD